MKDFFQRAEEFIDSIPDLVVGLLLLLFAVLVGAVAALIVTALLKRTKLGRKLGEIEKDSGRAISVIGKLVFLIVFLIFLPAALSKLGLEGVTGPITDLTESFVSYIPNVIASIVILVIGFFVAGIVSQLLTALLSSEKVTNWQGRLGRINLATLVSTVAYVFIAVPVVIAALGILNIEAISRPATDMLSVLLGAVPQILLAALLIFVGFLLARFVASFLASLLSSFGVDKKLNGWLNQNAKKTMKPILFEKIILGIVRTLIIVLFAVEAVNVLGFGVLTSVGQAVIAYLPSVLVAVVFGVAAFVLCRLIDSKLQISSPFVKRMIKIALVATSAFIVLSQLKIAPIIVNTAFIVLIGACGIAFALAVGLGGRQFVQDNLSGVKVFRKKEQNENGKNG